MPEIIGGVVLLVVIAIGIWWLWKACFGVCDYCGARDIVPDHGLFFYCNHCRRKF